MTNGKLTGGWQTNISRRYRLEVDFVNYVSTRVCAIDFFFIFRDVKMLIKVKTLTGKEIELDIEPNDKVERIKEKVRYQNSYNLQVHAHACYATRVCVPVLML